jgi:hypothetical protein
MALSRVPLRCPATGGPAARADTEEEEYCKGGRFTFIFKTSNRLMFVGKIQDRKLFVCSLDLGQSGVDLYTSGKGAVC